MATLEARSIDAIITDLPYGTTACKWDAVIPFAPLWEQVRRALKPKGVFVTTARHPFGAQLIVSNLAEFRHEWIWKKDKAGNFAAAKYQPLAMHESVLVFGATSANYYAQKTIRDKPIIRGKSSQKGADVNAASSTPFGGHVRKVFNDRCPSSVISGFGTVRKTQHPTEKPVELMRYLIRTYTKPGDTVLDPCCGSGTTGVAARAEGRNCVLIEREEKYLEITRQRLLANAGSQRTRPLVSENQNAEAPATEPRPGSL